MWRHATATLASAARITQFYDDEIRARYFRGLDFAGPEGDPGWFGPGSAVWHVHSHMPALVFGLQCAAYLERFDPSIFWMGVDHSRIVGRDQDGKPTMLVDPEGAVTRLGHSVSFFIGTAYGSTATAERVSKTVRAMHHTVKGVRPDGLPYDADDPEWLRWNYATVVWGIATAHEFYHPNPLRGKKIDRYYRESSSRWAMPSAGRTYQRRKPRRWNVCIRICRSWPSPTVPPWPPVPTCRSQKAARPAVSSSTGRYVTHCHVGPRRW